MRLFVAVNINEKTRNSLLALRDELRSGAKSGSFTLPENLHLTLAFLGECSAAQVAAVTAAMDFVRFEPFELLIERVGRFGSGGRGHGDSGPVKPQDLTGKGTGAMARAGFPVSGVNMPEHSAGAIWWAGVRETPPMLDMQRDLTGRLTDAGFTLDRRKFSPHITLGRKVVTDAVPRRIKPFGETVYNIDLMVSEHIDGKLTYTPIYRTPSV